MLKSSSFLLSGIMHSNNNNNNDNELCNGDEKKSQGIQYSYFVEKRRAVTRGGKDDLSKGGGFRLVFLVRRTRVDVDRLLASNGATPGA